MSVTEFGVDVLAFGPHPDDVELFCGGVLIRMADFGYRTAVVDLTRGEMASNGTVQEREKETEAASQVLGLSFRENLGLPDAWLNPWSGYDAPNDERPERAQLLKVIEVIRRRRPEVVLIPWTEARHPDHAATGELLRKALFFAGVRKVQTEPSTERFVPRQILSYPMRHNFTPSFVVDTSAAAARKREAIRCYTSQISRTPDADPTLVSDPLSVTSIEARDRFYGSMIGVEHGEPLRAPNTLGLTDPVSHFRSQPFDRAFMFEARR